MATGADARTLDDAYAALGLGSGASDGQVRSRFRELALRHHPDRGGSSEEFVRAHWAYKTITGDRNSRHGGGKGGSGEYGPWLSAILDLAMRLIEFIDEKPWSGFWKAVAVALVGVGGAAAVYALQDRSEGTGQWPPGTGS